MLTADVISIYSIPDSFYLILICFMIFIFYDNFHYAGHVDQQHRLFFLQLWHSNSFSSAPDDVADISDTEEIPGASERGATTATRVNI
jgi:hypothetical protein